MPKPVKAACPFKLGVNVRSSVPHDRLERDISDACGTCLGPHAPSMGVLAGDNPSKEQLRFGPKFKLEVRPSHVKAMGLSVFAAEKIPIGAAVVEVVGVVMTRQEARVIYPEYKRKKSFT